MSINPNILQNNKYAKTLLKTKIIINSYMHFMIYILFPKYGNGKK